MKFKKQGTDGGGYKKQNTQTTRKSKKKGDRGGDELGSSESHLDVIFENLMFSYDFMQIVMYPTLKNRREFVHECWVIAKSRENLELKMAISTDPYFYLTREDLVALLITNDDAMIK